MKHIQEYLKIVVKYYEKWKFKINSDKTELIVFLNAIKEEKIKTRYVMIDGTKIEIKTKVKNLGYRLDHKLSHNYHVKDIKKKAFSVAFTINILFNR